MTKTKNATKTTKKNLSKKSDKPIPNKNVSVINTNENPILHKTYKQLLSEKEKLKSEIDKLNAELDGKNNKKVADEIGKLQIQKLDINNKISETKKYLERLEKELQEITTKISQLSTAGKEKLYDAILKQRWFFFKEPEDILFDSYTGILLPNLDFHKTLGEDGYAFADSTIAKKLKELKFGGYANWELPDSGIASKIFSDDKFPFYEDIDRIYVTNFRDGYYIHSLQPVISTLSILPAAFLPINTTFASILFSPNNKAITDNERIERIINLFNNQNWRPIFNDEKAGELYNKIFVTRPALLKKYGELEREIAKLEEQNLTITEGFNFETEFSKYDQAEINRSLISYNNAVIKWLSRLLASIKAYKSNEDNIFKLAEELSLKLNSTSLSFDSDIIKTRQEYLSNQLNFNIETVEYEFIKMKQNSEQLKEKLEATTDLEELAKIESQKYPSFNLIAEQTANILNNKIKQINWFKENREIASKIIEIHEEWCEDYEILMTTDKIKFEKKCSKELIDAEKFNKWFDDWKNEREKLEERILPLIKAGFEGKINFLTLNDIMEKVKQYREELSNFYLTKRIPIYLKNANKDNEELLDSISYEKELFDISVNFQNNIEDLIFETDNTETRLFIAEWASQWIDVRIAKIIAQLEKSSLSETIAKEALKRQREFEKQSFATLISSKEKYALQREEKINNIRSLTRKMLLEAEKTK